MSRRSLHFRDRLRGVDPKRRGDVVVNLFPRQGKRTTAKMARAASPAKRRP